jgi:hypothetical protein
VGSIHHTYPKLVVSKSVFDNIIVVIHLTLSFTSYLIITLIGSLLVQGALFVSVFVAYPLFISQRGGRLLVLGWDSYQSTMAIIVVAHFGLWPHNTNTYNLKHPEDFSLSYIPYNTVPF